MKDEVNGGVHSDELFSMCKEHFNEPMLSHGELRRCIGYAETAIDCYIITLAVGGKLIWNTCVGGYTWLALLKEQGKVTSTQGEEWNDYTRLDTMLQLNGAPKQENFVLKLVHDDFEEQS